jgi:hypothetical protein
MDSDWLAERDRARRVRKQKQAKTQLIVLGLGMLLALALVGVRYQTQDHSEPESIRREEETKPVQKTTRPKIEPPSAMAVSQPDIPPEAPIPEPTAPSEKKADDSMRPPTEKECYATLEEFLKAPDIDTRLKLVIEKAGLSERMKEFYESRGGMNPEIGNPVSSTPLNIGVFAYNSIDFQSSSSPTAIGRASFLRAPDGKPKLDWESFVGWSPVPWKALTEGRKQEETLIRAYVSKDDYYNYEFTDTHKFSSYRIRNADGSLAINGFVEKGSPIASALLSRFEEAEAAVRTQSPERTGVWLPLTLRVKFPPDAGSDHCVHLMEIVESRWLLPEEL